MRKIVSFFELLFPKDVALLVDEFGNKEYFNSL